MAQLVDSQSNTTRSLSLLVRPNTESSFVVDASHIGITSLLIQLGPHNDDDVILATVYCSVRVLRKIRAVDMVFNWAVLGQSLFNAFALGCGADWQRIRRHLADNVVNFLAQFVQQLFLLPVVRKLMSSY